jgi:type IV secretion system protein VirB9
MNKRMLFGLVALAVSALCNAVQIPEAGRKDPRIRFAVYDPYDVVTIFTRVGLETHLVLDPDEKIIDMTGGDVEAWGVATKLARNGVFLKPAGELPDANLHVITNKRTYSFDLRLARKAKGEIGFMTVYFRYPSVEHAANAAAKESDEIRALLNAASPTANRRYSVQGSGELAPIEAWDDGRTTFLRFRARSSIPAIYSAFGEDASLEKIENTNMKNDVVQIHGVRRKLVLRIGRETACVFNDGFDLNALRPSSNTTSPHVNRTLKGPGK